MSESSEEWSNEERHQALAATLSSEGWQQVIVPRLWEELRDRRHRLETSPHVTLEEIRGLQAEIGLLKRLIYEAREMFA